MPNNNMLLVTLLTCRCPFAPLCYVGSQLVPSSTCSIMASLWDRVQPRCTADSTDGGCVDDREPSDFISVYAVHMNDVPEPMGPVKHLNFRFLDDASV